MVFGVDRLGRRVLEGRVKVRFGMAGMVFEASPGAVSHGTARQVWRVWVGCGKVGSAWQAILIEIK